MIHSGTAMCAVLTLAFTCSPSSSQEKSSKMESINAVGSLPTGELYISQVTTKTTGAVCKLINGKPVWWFPPNEELPGTDNFIILTPNDIQKLKDSPSC